MKPDFCYAYIVPSETNPPHYYPGFTHDALGEVVLSGLDVNGNGTLNLDGPDRVSSNSVAYVQSGDPWWVETRQETGSTKFQ